MARFFYHFPFGYLAQIVVLGSVIGVYFVLPQKGSARRIFAWTVGAAFLLLFCVLVIAFNYLPILSLSGAVR